MVCLKNCLRHRCYVVITHRGREVTGKLWEKRGEGSFDRGWELGSGVDRGTKKNVRRSGDTNWFFSWILNKIKAD